MKILKSAFIGLIVGVILFLIGSWHASNVPECWACLLYWMPIFPFLWLGDALCSHTCGSEGVYFYGIPFLVGYTLWGIVIGGIVNLIKKYIKIWKK